jgi:hypothetical protein
MRKIKNSERWKINFVKECDRLDKRFVLTNLCIVVTSPTHCKPR